MRRLALGLTLREAAGTTLTAGFLSRLERGVRQPSTETLRRLAPTLQTSVHWLETGEHDPAEELARFVLSADGSTLPERAQELARMVLARRPIPERTPASG